MRGGLGHRRGKLGTARKATERETMKKISRTESRGEGDFERGRGRFSEFERGRLREGGREGGRERGIYIHIHIYIYKVCV